MNKKEFRPTRKETAMLREQGFDDMYKRFYEADESGIPFAWRGYGTFDSSYYKGATKDNTVETHLTTEESATFHTKFVMPKEFPIEVPSKILLVCMALAKRDEHNEFSIILKGSMTDDGFVVSEDLLIPEQTVSGASVDYDNIKMLEYKQQGYNTVIHFHPMSLSKFSGTDDEYINTNFDCSILFNDYEFSDSIVNLKIGNVRLQVKGKVNVRIEGIELDTSKIQTFASAGGKHV